MPRLAAANVHVSRILHALLLSLALAGLAAADPPPRFAHDIWTIDRGLPENSVNAVAQTRDGYLWLGTYEGLVRFDGVQFRVFDKTNTPALASHTVYRLLEDRAGSLWIGTNGGGLVRYRDGVFTPYTSAQKTGLRNDVVRVLFEDRKGALWIGTDGGAHQMQGGRFQAWGTAEGLASDAVRAITEDADGRIWVGTAGGGLDRLEADGVRHLGAADGLPSENVRCMFGDRQGRIWIGTGGGLAVWDGQALRRYTTKDGLSHDIVTAVYQDRKGTIWLGTNGGGLTTWRDGRFTAVPEPGLTDTIVYVVTEDREGSLWVGTYVRGLHRLREAPFTSLTTRDGLPNDLVKTIHQGPDGAVWIATNGGGLVRWQDGNISTITTKDGLSADIVISVFADPTGTVWAGTYLRGLNRIRDGKVTVWTTADGLAHNHVSALHVDRKGTVWVGTYGGGLSLLRDGRFQTVSTAQGLANDVVRTLLEDRAGDVWVGTNAGLSRVHDGTVTSWGKAEGLASPMVMSLFEDEAGVLWLGTRGGGLVRFKDGRFQSVTQQKGLFNDVVYRILDDGQGDLWMSCDQGVFRVRKSELDAVADGRAPSLSSVAYGRGDGMPTTQGAGGFHPAGWRMTDGKLWFPTIAGVAILDPTRVARNTTQPPVVIEKFVAGGRELDRRRPLVMEPGTDRLEIQYTGLSFLTPERMHFRYRLEGFDEDWVDAGSRRAAFYTNLPPGRYRFRVIAGNSDGVWNNDGAVLEFQLRPHFWQSWAFYAGTVLTVGVAGFGLYRLRVRALRERERELRALVDERTGSLQREKEKAERALAELEEAHARLARSNAALSEASQMKTELLGIAAHDMKNPLQSIMGCAELILGDPTQTRPTHEKAGIIYRSSKRMLGLVSQLVETSVLESGQMTLQKRTVDLGQSAEAVVAANEQQARHKEQRLLAEIEPGCLVEGDEDRLREAIDNLVSNAIKYSQHGREVRIRVRRAGARVRLEVQDQGPGIAERDRPRLFGKFQRLGVRPTGGESSTGLGLAIVKQLVELHDGRVSAESDGPGCGSTFVMDLPASPAEAAVPPSPETSSAAP